MRPQVLVYGNRKQDDMHFPFSTKADKERAFLLLFRYLRKTWKVYQPGDMTTAQRQWYERAMSGEGVAAIRLLTLRKGYEYEQWHIESVPTKDATRLSRPIAPKAFYGQVKDVRTRRDGFTTKVSLLMPNNKELEFVVVPSMATHQDWDDLSSATHFLAEALETEHQRDMHNAEGLKEALSVVNELRHALHIAQNPETASPTCSPKKILEYVNRKAEEVITKYSNTPLEKLVTVKRRPTSLDEANERLAEAKRCISALVYTLKKSDKTQQMQDVLKTYNLEGEFA